jgi:hypothetical protein
MSSPPLGMISIGCWGEWEPVTGVYLSEHWLSRADTASTPREWLYGPDRGRIRSIQTGRRTRRTRRTRRARPSGMTADYAKDPDAGPARLPLDT